MQNRHKNAAQDKLCDCGQKKRPLFPYLKDEGAEDGPGQHPSVVEVIPPGAVGLPGKQTRGFLIEVLLHSGNKQGASARGTEG